LDTIIRNNCVFFLNLKKKKEEKRERDSQIIISPSLTHNHFKEHWNQIHYIGIDMEKSNQPVHVTLSELKDGDKEIVDAEFLVDLLESYRFGKDNVPAREFRSKAAATAPAPVNTTEIELEEDNDGSQAQGTLVNLSVSYMFFCLLIFGTSTNWLGS
jgi:hypothetical protein